MPIRLNVLRRIWPVLVAAAEASAAAQPRPAAARARRRDRQPDRAQRRRQDELPRGALLRPHRPLVPHRRPPRPDPVRRLASPAPRRRCATRTGSSGTLLASVSRTEGRRHLLDGSPADPATLARHRPPVAVFSPDRLALVKGPPARAPRPPRRLRRRPLARRARSCAGATARRWPSATRCSPGSPPAAAAPAELDAWDATLAEVGGGADRGPRRGGRRARAGLRRRRPRSSASSGGAALEYAPRAAGSAEEIRAGLAERREADLRLGRTSWGPHLDELKLLAAEGRSLRRYGSQGQQRAGPAGPDLRRARGAAGGPPGRRRCCCSTT